MKFQIHLAHSKLSRNKILLCLLCFALCGSCKEAPLPEELIGEVVFYAKGDLASEALNVEAGINDYYMESSYRKNSRDLISFEGELLKRTCMECGESLRIEITDSNFRNDGDHLNMEEILRPGRYNFRSTVNLQEIFEVRFASEIEDNTSDIDSIIWDFGDGAQSGNLNPRHAYVDPVDLNPEVCFRTRDINGCESLICNKIDLDDSDCKVDFSYMIDDLTGFVSFLDESNGAQPLTHRWNFGDGFGASLGNPGYYFGTDGSFTVCLTITDANGCRRTLCKQIGTDENACSNNFNYEINLLSGPEAPQFSRVLIQWTDENGKIFRSDRKRQREDAYVEILANEAGQENIRGEATRELDLKFSCTLFAENGEEIDINIRDAVMAVAHP